MLVLHAHNHDRSEHHDLTDWVKRLEISLSTQEPWTSIAATLRLPHADRLYAPDPDDWLSVHELPSGRTIAWGQVDESQEPGLVREGTSLTGGSPQVTASSWLSAMGKAQIYAMASQGVRTSAGTLFTLEEWSDRFTEIMRLYEGRVGPVLAKMVRMFGRLTLPETLGGGQLGSNVAVAHDSEGSSRLGLISPIDIVRGAAESIGDHAWPESTTALSLLTGLFYSNRDLIEFFEVLTPFNREVLTNGTLVSGAAALVNSIGTIGAASRTPVSSGLGRAALATSEGLSALALVPDSRLSVKLRSIPTLVYRLRPWREEGLAEYLAPLGGDKPMVRRAIERFRDLAPARTWPASPDYKIAWDEIRSFEPPGKPARINAVTAEVPGAADPVQFWEDAGLPFGDYKDMARHGLRAMVARWPFIDVHNDDAFTTMTMVAGVAAQMFLHQERFLQGTLKLTNLRLDLQPGRVFEATLPGVKVDSERRFTAYVERVRHSLTREGVSLVGRTDITYSRGLYENQTRTVRPQPSERGTEATRRGKAPFQREPARLASSGPSFFDRAATCSEGRATVFPTSNTLDLTKVPSWLVDWAAARGFRRADLEGEMRASVLISAACAYVVEAYWAQASSPFPAAQIDVLASVRSADNLSNHKLGYAFDFSVITVPALTTDRTHAVLQTWASLAKLSGAGRIPRGGAGVYINFGFGGLTGTRPDQAGAASRPKGSPLGTPPDRRFPRGGSAGVHYDYRGSFGFEGTSTTWIAADLDGDGADELTLSRDDRRIVTDFLPAQHPDVLAYFNAKGANDPSLIAVGPTVPNALQVLGQEPSCFARGR